MPVSGNKHVIVGPNFAADVTATQRRAIALAAQWNREISGADLTYLKSWLESNYGPF